MIAKTRIFFSFGLGLLLTGALPVFIAGESSSVEIGANGEATSVVGTDDDKVQQLEGEVQAIKEILADVQGKLFKTETDLSDAEQKLSESENDLAVASEEATASDARASASEQELVDAQGKLKASAEELAAATRKIDAANADHTNCLDGLTLTQEALKASDERARTLDSSLAALESKLAGMEVESGKKQEQQASILSKMEADVSNLKDRLKESVSLATAKADELAKNNEELGKVKAKMEAHYCDADRILADAKSFVTNLIG
uniref:Chromosome partition protein Smc n=1 Tax=Odontella aurita TaxID=265563 RepID=A0A7S4K316_9STRA